MHHHSEHPVRSLQGVANSHARRGNAIVVTSIIASMVAALVVTSTEGVLRSLREAKRATYELTALAAVEAVLARRESVIIDLASKGDPTSFVTLENYGIDYFNGCEVRWKIEPVRTPPKDATGANTYFITNPGPDTSWTPPSASADADGQPYWQPNDFVYIFRVSGEAAYWGSGGSENSGNARPLASVQSVRFASMNKQPLFRYVIFYAQEGPKGDLELSHGSDVKVLGSVHSNGSIFLGSGPSTNAWAALKPVIGRTDLGPSANVTWPTWVNGTSYQISDKVQIGTSKYKSTAPHLASADTTPGTGPAWTAVWEKVDKIRVNGVDGIYRLSKQTTFGAINGFPMSGTQPSGFSASSALDLTTLGVVGETGGKSAHYLAPPSATTLPGTFDGYQINPARIKDDSNLQTVAAVLPDDRLTINGTPIVGVPTSGPANDSRDIDRALKWKTSSAYPAPGGFLSYARTEETGGRVLKLPLTLSNRPFEAQAISSPKAWAKDTTYTAQESVVERFGNTFICQVTHQSISGNAPHQGAGWATYWKELDGEPHQYARPLFAAPGPGGVASTSTAFPTAGIIVEAPGQYLRYALGSEKLYLTRDMSSGHFTGWKVTDILGAPSLDVPLKNGLIIRERAVPDVTRYPDHFSRIAPVGSLTYMPYAYGKHSRPTTWPFTAGDVSSEMFLPQDVTSGNEYSSSPSSSSKGTAKFPMLLAPVGNLGTNYNRYNLHLGSAIASQGYAIGGSLDVRAAVGPGNNFPTGWYDNASLIKRLPYLYNENWRLIRLAQHKEAHLPPGGSGLRATFFNDAMYDPYPGISAVNAGFKWLGPFGGGMVGQSIETTGINRTWSAAPIAGCGNKLWSVRYEGFITPPLTQTYKFMVNHTWGVRMWIDHRLVVDSWRHNTGGALITPASTGIPMTANQVYPFTFEFFHRDTSTPTVSLSWEALPDITQTVIPNSAFILPDTSAKSNKLAAKNFSTFSAAEFRIDKLGGNPLEKVALMVGAGAGLPLLADGRQPYAAICYSPSRGFFMQARGQLADIAWADGPVKFVGNATTTAFGNATITNSTGEMSTEDRNNNNALDLLAVPSEDANSNGVMDDPATVDRVAKMFLIGPVPAFPVTNAPVPDPRQHQRYRPSSAGPTTWGTSINSGASNDSRLLALSIVPNPFVVPEGTVDKVYRGPLVLESYYQPQRRITQSMGNVSWYGILNPATLASTSQLFRAQNNSPTDNFRNIRWFLKSTAGQVAPNGRTDVGTTPSALSSINYPPFLQRDEDFNTTSSPNRWTFMNVNTNINGYIAAYGSTGMLTSGITRAYVMNNIDTGHQDWGAVTAAKTIDPVASPSVVANAIYDMRNVYYLTAPIDTRPKIFQGSTFVRVLTSAETLALMDETFGPGHIIRNTLPAYPTPVVQPYAPGEPAAGAPARAQGFPEHGWLVDANPGNNPVGSLLTTTSLTANPAVAVAGETPNQTWIISWADDLRQGDVAWINRELIRINWIQPNTPVLADVHLTTPSPLATINVNRNLVGGRPPWPVNATITPNSVSSGHNAALVGPATNVNATTAVIFSASPGYLQFAVNATATAWIMADVSPGGILVGDYLRVESEIVRVLAVGAFTPGVPNTQGITVARGNPNTGSVASSAHAANLPAYRVTQRTFRVDRQRTVVFDRNNYISASGSINKGSPNTGWYWNDQPLYQPWNLTWAAIIPPAGGSLRPDTWYPTTSQPNPPTVGGASITPLFSTPYYINYSARTVPSAGSVAGLLQATPSLSPVSARWSDDRPTSVWPQAKPVGANGLWLRVEKTNGTELKFSYREGDSGPYTTLKRAAPDTSDATIDVGPWFSANAVQTTLTGAISSSTATIPVATTVGFKVHDMILIGGELIRITAIPNGTTITATSARGQLGTTAATASASTPVRRISADHRGPDLQVSIATQSGPRYWTFLNSAVGGTYYPGNNQVWTVYSTKDMQVGDILQIQTERVQVVAINSATQVTVVRGADGSWTPGIEVPDYGLFPSPSVGPNYLIMCVTQTAANATTLACSGIKIVTTDTAPSGTAAPYEIIDNADWDAIGGGAAAMSQYLASQYQVLWGTHDITEDFFTYNEDDPATRLATEDWIYQPREFWSQSRWFDQGRTMEKDPDTPINGTTHDDLTNRELFGKTTLLTLNLRSVQDYLKTRMLGQATADMLAGGPTVPVITNDYTLKDRFNGLFYVARFNRYAWNPVLAGSTDLGVASWLPKNPWNHLLPNYDRPLLLPDRNNFTPLAATALAPLLQPYSLAVSPAILPQDFHHGVRLREGASIDWGFSAVDPSFGQSKTTVCTPNQLYLQGDLNNITHSVSYKGATVQKLTPMAVMGDAVTLLSNTFQDSNYQQPGLQITAGAVTDGGTLAYNQIAAKPLPGAVSTSFYSSILTHNIPTSRSTVKNGESSAFINTMMFLEDWVGEDCNFIGSLVVMDSRRYSKAFLLEGAKTYGQTPFGFTGGATWEAIHGATLTQLWGGNIGAVQGPPNRNMDFNSDLLTPQGVPAFTPFGVTASGVGGWTRINQQ